MGLRHFILLFFFWTINTSIYCQYKILDARQVNELLQKGNKHFRNADFENSLKTLRVALYHSIKLDNDTLTAEIYNRIARNFGELSEDEKSLLYLNKALFYAQKSDAKSTELMVLINICNLIENDSKANINIGIKKCKEALLLSEKLKDTATNITINMNMAMILFDDKQFDQGYPYLQYINTNFDKHGEAIFIPSIAMLNGMYSSFKNENEKANNFFIKGIRSGDKIVLKEDKQDLFREYSSFLYKIGNYKEAHDNLKIFIKIEKELFNKNKLKKANIAGINFEIDEFKREIDKIENEKKIQSKQLNSSKIINYLLITIAIILGLLLFLFYKNIKNKTRSNKSLALTNLQLKEAKEFAEEATKVKSQFVSTITHELRTPLYGVIGMTDILKDEHKELKDNPYIKSLNFSAQYLLSLVNDILKINKLEENTTQLFITSFDLKSEIDAIVSSLSFLAKNNNNTVTSTIDKSIPNLLLGDKLLLAQILINLIGNSIKFTQNGSIFIEINSKKIIDNTHFIEFKIIDNGIGIATEDLDKIFEKFVQVSRKETDYQGTGLGLAIVKRLLDLYKSEVKVESTIGVGTTFSFILELRTSHEKIDRSEKILNFPSTENYKILVVEDNKINQIVSKKIIQKYLGSCVIANDGFEAISILKLQKFDVILMDINMPGIDGFQTSIKIRETDAKTPIIALTAASIDQIKDKVAASGINDIIVKPFEPNILIQIIKKNIH